MEIVLGDHKEDKQKELEFWGNVPSVDEARKKLRKPPSFSMNAKELNLLRGNVPDKVRDFAADLFNSRDLAEFRNDIKAITTTEFFHNEVLPRRYLTIDETFVYKNLGSGFEESKREEAFRITMLLNHSVDVNILKLRVKTWEVEGKISQKMAQMFYEDRAIQKEFVNAMRTNVQTRDGVSSFVMDYDKDPIEVLARRWTRLAEGGEDDKQNVRDLFIDTNGNPSDYLANSVHTEIAESIKLADLHTPDIDYKNEIHFGRIATIAEEERRVEEARFLMMIERKVKEIFSINFPDFKFPENVKFNIKVFREPEQIKKGETYSSWAANDSLIWKHGSSLEGSALDFGARMVATNTTILKPNELFDKANITYLSMRLDLNALSSFTHELTHLWMNKLLEGQMTGSVLLGINDPGENVTKTYKWLYKLSKDESEVRTTTSEFKESRVLWSSIGEGMSIFNQTLMIDYLLDEKPLPLTTEDIKSLEATKRSRGYVHKIMNDEYGEGQVIIWSVFRNTIESGGSQKDGIRAVTNFISKLDIKKITDLNSRKVFKDAIIDDELTIIHKAGEKISVGGENIILESEVRKNKILDYLSSENPEKRKRAVAKILELFGKE